MKLIGPLFGPVPSDMYALHSKQQNFQVTVQVIFIATDQVERKKINHLTAELMK